MGPDCSFWVLHRLLHSSRKPAPVHTPNVNPFNQQPISRSKCREEVRPSSKVKRLIQLTGHVSQDCLATIHRGERFESLPPAPEVNS